MYRLFFISDKVCRPFEKIWLYCTDEYKKQARLLLTAYINLCGYELSVFTILGQPSA